ncbi:MAG: cardiolipin synthase [Verrucomicrobiales bacterium]|nr:cardiolipin synthase [Verrucomicrobiales bacterium]
MDKGRWLRGLGSSVKFTVLAFLHIYVLLNTGCALISGKPARHEILPMYSAASPAFKHSVDSLLDPPFIGGNSITTLQDGDQIFPAMLSAIQSAHRSINFESYVFWEGHVAREFVAALAERARAGVKVNVMLDALGTHKMGIENLNHLREAGVDVFKYHTILWLDPRRYNYRTHRKLLIVDGKVAFIGGVGIADEWAGNGEGVEKYHDTQYEVRGPVVAQLQGTFVTLWLRSKGDLLYGPDYFPPLTTNGTYQAQTVSSSTWDGNLDFLYRLAIASAQKTLRIENAYFLPDKLIRTELVAAAKRGVKVEIIVPGELIDSKLMRMASKKHYPELLKAGIKIYEYQMAMLHVKLMIVDDAFVSVGSGNFDNRSTRLNAEANLNVLDTNFAAEQTALFEKDKARSRETKLHDHKGFHLLQHIVNLALPAL